MKNIRQIRHKSNLLKRASARKSIGENFGDRAQLLLSQYIGDIYQYPYEDRLLINIITSEFFNWCSTYEGK